MKKILASTLCSSILFTSVCNAQENNVTENAMSLNPPLISGIDKEHFDSSVRAQDDFYNYVNGTWLKNQEIPADKTSIGSFYELRDKALLDLKAIIAKLSTAKDLKDNSNEKKIIDLYNSFMDLQARNENGIKPIQPILDLIDDIKSKDELAAFFGRSESLGIGSPLGFYISEDAKNSSAYAMHIWQNGLSLPDEDYYFNKTKRFEEIRKEYIAYIENLFTLAGFKNSKSAAKTVMQIEKSLAIDHLNVVETRDSQKRYNKFATADLIKLTNNFNWTEYLNALGVSKQKEIIINQPDFIKGFGEVFHETKISDWKTYLKYHTINNFADILSEKLSDANFEFYSKELYGQQEQKPLWKRGINITNAILGEAIGQLYVEEHFSKDAKNRMITLVENLRDSYKDSFNDLSWMSDNTKKAAQIKLAAFKAKIGYPDRWEDYSQLFIDKSSLVRNVLNANAFNYSKEIAKLGEPIHTWEWGMTPQTVNAYYNPTVNEIVFPAAILQPPFFNMEADDAVNYGGIGAVIGHEMGHGFDDQGSKYDEFGNLKNWWSPSDLSAFKERTKALVEQFNNYYVFPDLTVNGELTLGENIGDLSGATIAYRAYIKSLNGAPAPIIDGLTGAQRFFIGFTQIWRSKTLEKSLRNRVATDPHSPARFRALAPLSNMDEFYNAFDVQEGDAMYIAPENRVYIW